ncbi:MAG: DUF2808 domain-containing protein [Cyanosarcina radialis HA8281-LM2]|jgi:S1-C subfamily serine protease|nr:DUF2808 domain-containing protein [Cyanosarcina radialis HA8281-LM2]
MMKFDRQLAAAILGTSIALVQPHVASAVSPQEVGKIAKQISVQIDNGNDRGSGVIIKRQGNTYYVLTAKHVVPTASDRYAIVTPDGDRHPLNYTTARLLPGVDLAVVEFNSNRQYSVAQLGNAETATEGTTVYVAGFPKGSYQFSSGSISSLRSPSEAIDGYAIGYVNNTAAGMSGGPVLDDRGRLIGIHGRANGDEIVDPQSGRTVRITDGFNWGIPINTFLKLAPQAGINLDDRVASSRPVTTQPSAISTTPTSTPSGGGRVSFAKSPRLVTAAASSNRAYEWGATYYFTVSIPETAGVPLQQVAISQIEGDKIKYRLEETHAFEGRHRDRGAKLNLGQVALDKETQTVLVTFDPPVPPGKTVTIGLNPTRNPSDIICLFRVKVFPAGEQVQPLDLGVGRLHFYWH